MSRTNKHDLLLPTGRRRALMTGAGVSLAAVACLAAAKTAEAAPSAAIGLNPDAELIAACDRFADLERNGRHILDQAPNTHEGDAAAQAALDPIREEQAAILDRACEIEAQTWDGMKARLRMAFAYQPKCVECPSDWDDSIAGAILEDLNRMLGAAPDGRVS